MSALIETITAQAKSGKKYEFSVYPIDYECPDEKGVYMFTRREPNPVLHHIIYIGIASSFQKRFYTHHKDSCIDKNKANCICLLNVPNEQERKNIEKDLLAAYNTPCNEVNN